MPPNGKTSENSISNKLFLFKEKFHVTYCNHQASMNYQKWFSVIEKKINHIMVSMNVVSVFTPVKIIVYLNEKESNEIKGTF